MGKCCLAYLCNSQSNVVRKIAHGSFSPLSQVFAFTDAVDKLPLLPLPVVAIFLMWPLDHQAEEAAFLTFHRNTRYLFLVEVRYEFTTRYLPEEMVLLSSR